MEYCQSVALFFAGPHQYAHDSECEWSRSVLGTGKHEFVPYGSEDGDL